MIRPIARPFFACGRNCPRYSRRHQLRTSSRTQSRRPGGSLHRDGPPSYGEGPDRFWNYDFLTNNVDGYNVDTNGRTAAQIKIERFTTGEEAFVRWSTYELFHGLTDVVTLSDSATIPFRN